MDTSIWRDYFEDRNDGIKPLGEFAFSFLQKCIEHKIQIVVSDTIIFELEEYYSKEKIEFVFSPFEEIIKFVSVEHSILAEARTEWIKLGKILPFNDVVHAVKAKHSNAVLITRDKHFELLKEIVESCTPENATLT